MAQNGKIWVGPGSLRAGSDFKGEKVVRPGHEIPKGFVSSDRIKQLEKRGKICSESAFTKRQAAAGVVPVADAAGKIKALEAEVKELELVAASGEELTDKIKELEATVSLLEGVNEELEDQIKEFKNASKGGK